MHSVRSPKLDHLSPSQGSSGQHNDLSGRDLTILVLFLRVIIKPTKHSTPPLVRTTPTRRDFGARMQYYAYESNRSKETISQRRKFGMKNWEHSTELWTG